MVRFRPGDGGFIPDDVYRQMCEREPLQQAELRAKEEAVRALVAAVSTPDVGGRLVRMCFDAAPDSRRSEDPAGARRRARMRSLQFFEHAIGVPAGTMQPPERYIAAGWRLMHDGDADGGTIMHNFGMLLFTLPSRRGHPDEVSTHHERWCGRHHLWQMFPGGGPLPGSVAATGPGRRAAREDEVLARLLSHPGDPGLRDLISEDMFTSHVRAELYRATAEGGGSGDVRSRFAYAMHCAPGWALDEIGGPGGAGAMQYLDRLRAAPVTAGQARAAARAVAAAHETDAEHCDIVLTADSDLRQVLRRRQRVLEAGLAIDESPAAAGIVLKASPELIRKAEKQREEDRREHERLEQRRQARAARVNRAAVNVAAVRTPGPRPLMAPPPPLPVPAGPVPRPLPIPNGPARLPEPQAPDPFIEANTMLVTYSEMNGSPPRASWPGDRGPVPLEGGYP